ncbi:MAG: hypothetical protein QM820_55005 [Minicystis sp.]
MVEIVDDCVVLVHSKRPPTADEWKLYMELLERNRTLVRRLCVFSEGAGPSAAQRQQVSDLVKTKYTKPIITAVVTPDPIARGIGTAIGWIYSDIKIFAPDRIDDAFKFLSLSEKQTLGVRRAIAGLRSKLSAAAAG